MYITFHTRIVATGGAGEGSSPVYPSASVLERALSYET
jgi:hypothetical protein